MKNILASVQNHYTSARRGFITKIKVDRTTLLTFFEDGDGTVGCLRHGGP